MRAWLSNLKQLFDRTPIREYGSYMTVKDVDSALKDRACRKMIEHELVMWAWHAWTRHRRIILPETFTIIANRPRPGNFPLNSIATLGWKCSAERHARLWRDPNKFGVFRVLRGIRSVDMDARFYELIVCEEKSE